MAAAATIKLRDVMTRGVECCRPEASLRDAAEIMRRLDVGIVPIRVGEKVEGVVTDRDLAIRVLAEGRDPAHTNVGDVMSREVVSCFDDQTVGEAATVMKERKIRRLLVCDHDDALVGVVSLGDLAVDTGDRKLVGDVLRSVSEPVHPEH